MDPLVAIVAEVEDEVRIPIWDQHTRVNHLFLLNRDIDGILDSMMIELNKLLFDEDLREKN